MRFVVDECTGPSVATWLREHGHGAYSVFESSRGATDDEILALAVSLEAIVVTNDKDFGDKVFRDRREHRGVVLLRLDDNTAAKKIAALDRLLSEPAIALAGAFVVVTERGIRVGAPPET